MAEDQILEYSSMQRFNTGQIGATNEIGGNSGSVMPWNPREKYVLERKWFNYVMNF